MRRNHPVGTLFKVWAQLTNREGGKPFLYTSYRDPYEVVSAADAQKFIRKAYGKSAPPRRDAEARVR
jgi:hypothetical protein